MAKQYDLIVVGAGMVGALAAILLAKSSMRIALIDKHSGEYTLPSLPYYDSRVSAISSQSQHLFEDAGVWQKLAKERIASYHKMKVWDGLGDGYIDFSAEDVNMPQLGHLVENVVLCTGLLNAARQADNIDLYLNETLQCDEISGHGVRGELTSGLTLDAQAIIAADGAMSRLRSEQSFDTVEWDYGHTAIVATIEVDRSHEHTAWQSFGEEGILAFLPLPDYQGRHFISIVWSVSPNEAESLLVLDAPLFCKRLEYAINGRFKVIDITTPRQAFSLRQRHAKQYVKEGIALVGDAAHTIHPLAGQGANLGFADVKALVDVLSKAYQRGEQLGAGKVLRRYQRARMLDNIVMSAGMEGLKRVFATQNPLLVQLRNKGMAHFHHNPYLKNKLIATAAGLSSFSL